MKFLFIIKKLAIFYFFVQNLSGWHFSVRESYNKIWKEELGSLSLEEREALKKFKNIHVKYGFGEKYLGRFFYLRKDPWKALKKQLSKKELSDLRKIFSIFQPKFEILYRKDFPLLKKWRKELERKANDKTLINPINKTLSTLYNVPSLKITIKVYLLLSSPTVFGGGASIGKGAITLEISRSPLKKFKQVIGAIWHETIHAYYEKYYFSPLLHKTFPNDQRMIDLVEEATARTVFFPSGALEEKFLKTHTSISGILKKHITSLLKLKKLVKKYIQKKKSFDKEYIEKASSLLSGLKMVIY